MSLASRRSVHVAALAVLLGVLLAACGSDNGDAGTDPSQPAAAAGPPTATPAAVEVEPAPELVGLGEWINSEPLTLAQLRGEPVLIVFWASW